MHCHLDYMANGEEVAADACEDGALIFANTVAPEGWGSASERFAQFGNVVVGFGMHPWFVAETVKAADVVALLEKRRPRFIGEVGLDFGDKHKATGEAQMRMLTAIATWAASEGDRLISLHSAKAARETIDILEQTGALATCTCIFHWFSGPSDQLKRAIDAGCFFSCGPRMFATRKGREYAKAIPVKRLLLETDAPPQQGDRYAYAQLRSELESAAQSVAAIKGEEALGVIAQTSARLLER